MIHITYFKQSVELRQYWEWRFFMSPFPPALALVEEERLGELGRRFPLPFLSILPA